MASPPSFTVHSGVAQDVDHRDRMFERTVFARLAVASALAVLMLVSVSIDPVVTADQNL